MKHDGAENRQPRGGFSTGAVAEVQGLYGPFSFPEKLLQQIWFRGEFDAARLATADGRAVKVLHPGRWNRLGGPDFKQARLRIGGESVTGDVEVHLHAQDWAGHRHAADPAYDDVVLHVVLFPGDASASAPASPGAGGRPIPIAVLLPLLWHDLEEYAADAAVERLALHPMARAREELLAMREGDLRAELGRLAAERWARKVHFAKLRAARLGWEAACHHAALEILGYRANRAPMLAIATEWPLDAWRKNAAAAADADAAGAAGQLAGAAQFADAVFTETAARGAWSKQGARPANHPRARLRQYARWVAANPDWPARLPHVFAHQKSAAAPSTRAWRQANAAQKLRATVENKICGGAIGGTRLDNLVCDGFLPLLATRYGADMAWLAHCWRHWWTGDMPEQIAPLLKGLRMTGTRDQPACHGLAQGLLGWLLANEDAPPRDDGDGKTARE
ncbi:MAG: DUF2851 family protein [Opitutaceae bacterium]|jgi:hypothetical protein|nr:DUF2851 family protein [Opitutaceae bacterium]